MTVTHSQAAGNEGANISFKPIRTLAVVGLIAGALLSTLHILPDFLETRQALLEAPLQRIQPILPLATEAVRLRNTEMADRITMMLLADNGIKRAALISPGSKILAQSIAPARQTKGSGLVYFLFGKPARQSFSLGPSATGSSVSMGTLQIVSDPYPAGVNWLQRSLNAILTSLLQALAITAVALLAFQRMAGRSIREMTDFLTFSAPKLQEKNRHPTSTRKFEGEIKTLFHLLSDFIHQSSSDARKFDQSQEKLRTEIEELKNTNDENAITLEQLKQELDNTNALFGAAFYSNSQLASISELETGRFIDVNDMWVETRGISRVEAIGKTADELNIWGGDSSREKIIEDVRKFGRLKNYETTSAMRSGEIRDFILNAEAISVNGRDLLFFSGMDITDRKKAAQNLQRSQKMEAVGQLTGGIAHDFNNLLAIILGNLELLKEATEGKPDLQNFVNAALHGTERGATLTDKLLGFSGGRASGHTIIQANTVIEGMEELIAKSVTASILVETKLSKEAWPVDIDPGDLEDAIVNLSLNAHDAMPEGGTLSIETYNTVIDDRYVALNPTATRGEYLAIKISDSGSGLPEELKEKIFEPFFTTKGQGKGTGLGLSMVFGFIERSNGHIRVESEPDTGTRFTLYLPRSKKKEKHPKHLPQQNALLPHGTETILIVDDEVSLIDITRHKLEDLGYTTRTATNGADAAALIKQYPDIDLVFSDVVMPGAMNGYQLSLAARDFRPTIKILLASGYTKGDDLVAAQEVEALQDLRKNLLSKPYNMAQLAHAIRTALDTDNKAV